MTIKRNIISLRLSPLELRWLDHGANELGFGSRGALIRKAWKDYLNRNGVPVESATEVDNDTKYGL